MTHTMPEHVRTVLCVDDDEDDREIITGTIALIDPSVNVVHVEDGLEAIEYLSRSKDTALPCLIILDINMPRMDGKQTIAEIKKDEVLNTVPIVIFSTSSSPMDYLFFEQFDVEMITKPSDITAMRQDIKRVLQYCVKKKPKKQSTDSKS